MNDKNPRPDCNGDQLGPNFDTYKHPIAGGRVTVYSLATPSVARNAAAKTNWDVPRRGLGNHFARRTRSELPLSF